MRYDAELLMPGVHKSVSSTPSGLNGSSGSVNFFVLHARRYFFFLKAMSFLNLLASLTDFGTLLVLGRGLFSSLFF